MARYIDAEKLCEGLKNMASVQEPYKQSTILGVVSTIENFPTADVAPRAEVGMEIFWEMDMLLMSITIDEEAEESFVGLDFDKYLALRRKYTKAETEMPKGDAS